MAIREIVKEGDPCLAKVCRPVEKFDERLWMLLDDMAETMHTADGVGLAAPQVGILRRAVTIDIGDGLLELINPKVVEAEGEQQEAEGCLSCPGVYGITTACGWRSSTATANPSRLRGRICWRAPSAMRLTISTAFSSAAMCSSMWRSKSGTF